MTHLHTHLTLVALSLLQAAAPPTARRDCHGDPLPQGAVARLGTVRLRHGDGVSAVVFSADGLKLATVSRDRTARVWDAVSGKQLHQFQDADLDYHAAAFSPDGKLLAISGGSAAQGGNTDVRLLDAASGAEVRRLTGHQQPAHALAFGPEGDTLLSVSCDQVITWEVASGRRLHAWKHEQATAALSVSPDRKTMASVSGETEDKAVTLRDAHTGRELRKLKGHKRGVMSVAIAPDGKTLASANPFEPIRIWDLTTGKTVRRLEQTQGGMALAFSPDGKVLAGGCMNGTVRLWEAATGKELKPLEGYRGWVNMLAFSPDGKVLALAGADSQTVHLWAVASGRPLRGKDGHQGHVHAIAYAPDGKRIASGGGDKQDRDTAVRIWDASTGRELHRLAGHKGTVLALAFSPDGRVLASGGDREDCVRLWDARTGGEVRLLKPEGKKNDECATEHRVSALAFSPDGKLLAAGIDEGVFVLWEAATGRQVRRLEGHEGRVVSIAFSADGKFLASGSVDRTVRLWEAAGGKELRQFGKHDDSIKAVAFSPDGKLLAAGSGDWQGTVYLWEAATGKEVGRIIGEQCRLFHIAFSPDGKTLAVGSADQSLRLWEVATRKERRRFPGHPGGAHALAFAPDGKRLASGSADSTVLVWDVAGAEAAGHIDWARLTVLWGQLGSEDAAEAERAIRTMLAAPEEALIFLRSRLTPTPPLPPDRLAQILSDLDHPRFQLRYRATNELAKLGELAEPLLRKKLAESGSLEVQRRVQMLLDRLDTSTLSPSNLRALRAFEVLERIGTEEVRHLLEAHVRESPESVLGQEARASLERLSRRRP